MRAVVRDYVRTGQPVGSRRLVEKYRVKASPATIRNEMGRLEEGGYLAQPHTSAGRIPTDLGYRWFVDNWPERAWPALNETARRSIEAALQSGAWSLEHALSSTSQLLSDLTEAAAVALAPPVAPGKLRRLEMFSRDAHHATLLIVQDNGEVLQSVVEFSEATDEPALEKLVGALNNQIAGLPLDQVPAQIKAGKGAGKTLRAIAAEVQRVIESQAAERVYRDGASNIVSPEKFSDVAVAHEILQSLERPAVVAELMIGRAEVEGAVVFIGHEISVRQMQRCSVVVATYRTAWGGGGSVGVIGPTRMDYPHTISAVEAVAGGLTRLLSYR